MYRVTQSVKIGNLNGKVINGIGKGTWKYKKKKVSMFCVITNIFYTVEYNNKTIGYRLKPDGICYCYYKERFNGDKKPEPAKEFIEFLKSMDIKSPYEMSFFHVYELDENGSILQELDPKDF